LDDGTEYKVAKTKNGKSFKMTSDDTHDYTTPNVGIITADGTPMILSFNTKCEALDPAKTYGWSTSDNKPVSNATASCVSAIFEINGTAKPNKFGKDVVAFNANGLGNRCALEIGDKCLGSTFIPAPLTYSQCEAQKSKLGIKYCSSDTDYWAGAVAQCGGVDKLPTMDDLAKIASEMYDNNPSIGARVHATNLTYTSGKATSLGLPEPHFFLWSNEEYSPTASSIRSYYPTYSRWGDSTGYRHGSYMQAICKVE
jgi:hypothetical protein